MCKSVQIFINSGTIAMSNIGLIIENNRSVSWRLSCSNLMICQKGDEQVLHPAKSYKQEEGSQMPRLVLAVYKNIRGQINGKNR